MFRFITAIWLAGLFAITGCASTGRGIREERNREVPFDGSGELPRRRGTVVREEIIADEPAPPPIRPPTTTPRSPAVPPRAPEPERRVIPGEQEWVIYEEVVVE